MVKFVIGVLVGIGLVVLASYLFVKGGGIFMGTDTKPLPLGETIAGAAVYGVGRKVRSQKSYWFRLLAVAASLWEACASPIGRRLHLPFQ